MKHNYSLKRGFHFEKVVKIPLEKGDTGGLNIPNKS